MDALERDWRTAPLSARQRALCEYAVKLTHTPSKMSAADLAPLRAAGLGDVAILEAIHVIALFAYMNRLADATGVDPEDFMASAAGGSAERR